MRKYNGTSHKDVNPQWLNCPDITTSAADTTTSLEVQVPIARVADSNKSVVLELFKVVAEISGFPSSASVAEAVDTKTLVVGTRNGGTTNLTFNDGSTICSFNTAQRHAFTAAGTYNRIEDSIIQEFNLQDGAGNGLLVGSDSIFLQLQSSGYGVTITGRVKILYRFKTVSYVEWIGIVQSQQ